MNETDRLVDYWATLPSNLAEQVDHGDLPQWLEAIKAIAVNEPSDFFIQEGVPTFSTGSIEGIDSEALRQNLLKLHPWRKGPLQIGDSYIDAEWDAREKWNIVEKALDSIFSEELPESLDILDIGCSNGFYLWQLFEKYKKTSPRILGVEPYAPNIMQFSLCHQLAGSPSSVKMLPRTFEEMPQSLRAFDLIFSMGVLYHRKHPIEHLMQIRHQLKKGGTMMLETLIVEGDESTCLVPQDRYQQMNNVWFLPSVPHLVRWLERCKFKDIQVHDVRPTSITEQRTTEWMHFHSLEQFLDPNDHRKTVEGYQAPTRCLISAKAP